MEKKDLPKGISDFKKLIESNCYYVDKSLFIEDIIKNCKDVTLITRPRRFGKTLNMSMLRYFFDIREKDNNRKLFTGLKIENSKYIDFFGKYPVIYLTMKEIKGKDYKVFYSKFVSTMSELYRENKFLLETLDDSDSEEYYKILNRKENGDYNNAVNFLATLLYEHYGVQPILLIDEYDAPYIVAKERGYLEELRIFLGDFYSNTLKEGKSKFTVVTGILKIVKESIFSGLNNLEVSTILDDDYNHFGMSENEVETALKYFNLETTIDDTRAWYNGYIFGGNTVYNPWSIMNHCIKGKLTAFWINTSGNTLIKDNLISSDNDVYKSLYKLLEDKEINITIKMNMVLENYLGSNALFTLMLLSGYLTVVKQVDENEYIVKIPNKEVKSFFRETFIEITEPHAGDNFKMLIEALKSGNIKGENSMEEALSNLLEKYLSYHDASKYEIFYHNLLLGIMTSFEGDYHVSSNAESGHGRYDLAMISKRKNNPSYIFEFKVASSENGMDNLGEGALKQIKDKNYKVKFNEHDNISEIAVIFFKKKVKLYQNN